MAAALQHDARRARALAPRARRLRALPAPARRRRLARAAHAGDVAAHEHRGPAGRGRRAARRRPHAPARGRPRRDRGADGADHRRHRARPRRRAAAGRRGRAARRARRRGRRARAAPARRTRRSTPSSSRRSSRGCPSASGAPSTTCSTTPPSTRRDGSVVEVGLRGGELTVRDHGPGIPAAERAHVFDRFYRGATRAGGPGSGLGLAIVRQVAETHGGSIAVEEAPGGGALFRLRAGARSAADAAPGETEAAASPEPRPPSCRAPRAAPTGRSESGSGAQRGEPSPRRPCRRSTSGSGSAARPRTSARAAARAPTCAGAYGSADR